MSGLILVRASIHLANVSIGEMIAVDPENEYVKQALRSGVFVRVPGRTEEIRHRDIVVGLRLVEDDAGGDG